MKDTFRWLELRLQLCIQVSRQVGVYGEGSACSKFKGSEPEQIKLVDFVFSEHANGDIRSNVQMQSLVDLIGLRSLGIQSIDFNPQIRWRRRGVRSR